MEIVEEDGKVAGLVLERNELRPGRDGRLRPESTGERETLPVTAVIRAIGYRSVPLPGVPFDERNGILPNRDGRLLDPDRDEVLPGEYVVGWAKRGPSGLIGTNKPDSQETVERMLEDLPALPAADDRGPAPVPALLAERDVPWVDFEDWLCLDRLEVRRGEAAGRPRVKLCAIADMLRAVAEERAEAVEA